MATFTKRIDSAINGLTDRYNSHWSPNWQVSNPSYGESGFLGVFTEWEDEWGDWYGGLYNKSYRFTGVTIPQGATITSAKITFTDSTTGTERALNFKIIGVDEDNTAEFTTSPISDARTRTHTSASVDWDATFTPSAGTTRDTSDIKTIIQEIVNRGGWSSGNAIGIYLYDDGTTEEEYYDYKYWYSYNDDAPLLTIVYETTSSSASPSASASATPSESFSPSLSPSITPSASPSLSPSISVSLSPSASISLSPSTSVSPSPSPQPPFFGLKIAKPGFDVLTETDPNKLIFSSDYNTLKYYKSGTITHSVSEADNTLYRTKSYYTHNLNFYPYFEVYCKDDLMSGWQPVGKFEAGAGAYRSFYAFVTKTRLYVVAAGYTGIGGAGESYDVVFKYKIFRNNLGL